jgi:hypothetical protein
MKFQILLLGVLFFLAADAARKPSQSVPTAKSAGPVAQQILTSCIDEGDGHYVLLDI